MDPSILYGKLANGLTYYIKNVKDGSDKIRMNLFMKVGNYNEQKGEQGFAHLIEHLAFSCGKDFPTNLKIDSTLFPQYRIQTESLGGQTGVMSTIYQLDVPTNRMSSLEVGLHWFENIMDLRLTPEKINMERGVLEQEIAGRVSNNLPYYFFELSKLKSSLFSCWNNDSSNYFEHLKMFPIPSLIEFYEKWYQPERMGIAIVGEIPNKKVVEKLIKQKFAKLKGKQKQGECRDCRLNQLKEPSQFVNIERKSARSKGDQVELYFHFRDINHIYTRKTWKGLKLQLIWSGLNKILNKRFSESGDHYNLAFYAYASHYQPEFSYYQIMARTSVNEEKKTTKMIFKLLQQVKEFGFSEEEWTWAKSEILNGLLGNDLTTSKYWIEQISNHICYGEALPINKTKSLYEWFSALSLAQFNDLTQKFLRDKDMPEDIGIIAPTRKSKPPYTNKEIRGWIQGALKEKINPYFLPYVPNEIMNEKEVKSLREKGFTYQGTNAFGVKEYLLHNGVKIILKTEKSYSNKIFIEGFSPHGASCFKTKDYFSAINAPSIVKNTGVKNINKFTLDRFLRKTSLWQGVQPFIDYQKTGIRGNAHKRDLETMLQLVFLYFTQPRKDKEAFLDWKSKRRSAYLNPSMTMSKVELNENINEFLGDKSNAPQGENRFNGISKTDQKIAYSIYKALYGQASNFTFIVSGDITGLDILPLLQKYLGNLPNNPDKFFCPQENVFNHKLPKGPIYKEFYAPKKIKNPLYSLVYAAKVKPSLDWKEYIKIKVFGLLMKSQIEELRFEGAGKLYFTSTGSSFSRELMAYQFRITLEPLAEELEILRNTCKGMVDNIRDGKINDNKLRKVIVSKMSYLKKIPQNSEYNYYRYGEPPVGIPIVTEYIKSIKPEDIQNTVKKYFNKENLMEFILKNNPETALKENY